MNENKTPAPDENLTSLRPAFDAFLESSRKLAESLGEFFRATVDLFVKFYAEPWRDAFTWYAAYSWAKRAHPKWVAIMERTKKRRVRKKYMNRILRDYKERKA